MPVSPAPAPAAGRSIAPAADTALRWELVAALDHDLRTSLTTVLGALQTLAHPERAPVDPDLAELLSAALAQAQKMRRLLDELPTTAAPEDAAPLLPPEVADLIRRAAETGDPAMLTVEVPDDLGPLRLPAPGLRRALAGILRRAGPPRHGMRVEASSRGGDCLFAITVAEDRLPAVPQLSRRLIAAMGGRIEEAPAPGSPALRLFFPGAVRCGPD